MSLMHNLEPEAQAWSEYRARLALNALNFPVIRPCASAAPAAAGHDGDGPIDRTSAPAARGSFPLAAPVHTRSLCPAAGASAQENAS